MSLINLQSPSLIFVRDNHKSQFDHAYEVLALAFHHLVFPSLLYFCRNPLFLGHLEMFFLMQKNRVILQLCKLEFLRHEVF